MAVKDMSYKEVNVNRQGAIYTEELSITSGMSDIYLFPVGEVTAIGCRQENGQLYFTLSSRDSIEAGSAVWEAWDGQSGINPAVRAFYFEWTSGTATAIVSVRIKTVT